jgi:hypothetical protein
MHGLDEALPLLVIGALLWLLKGLLEESRSRAGRRVADWLLPDGRPATYRFARLVVRLASAVAPRRAKRFEPGDNIAYYLFPREAWAEPGLANHRWDHLEAALAELDADEAGARVAQPVRMVLPLLGYALGERLRTLFAYQQRFAWWLLISIPLRLIIRSSSSGRGFCRVH